MGEGSTFTVQLPRGVLAELHKEHAPAPALSPALPVGAPKVLHIEDDPGVARSMALLLRLEGYDVISAATRDEALQHVEAHGLRPDLILTDYQLPMGHTGDEVVSEIVARLKSKPPTIMLTGDTATDHVDKAKVVADRILPKPVNVDVLLREMAKLLSTQG